MLSHTHVSEHSGRVLADSPEQAERSTASAQPGLGTLPNPSVGLFVYELAFMFVCACACVCV